MADPHLQIARSQLAAWAFCASGQGVLCLAYLEPISASKAIGTAESHPSLFSQQESPNPPTQHPTPNTPKPPSPPPSPPKSPSPNSTPSGLGVLYLSKAFGNRQQKTKPAIDDLTFKVSPSEIFALLDPNGAGKSTAISLIRGDIPPSSTNPQQKTSILIDSTSILTHRPAARARLGVCPQFDTSDTLTLTVTKSLHFYARVRGVADPAHNIEECISAFGLQAYRHMLAQKFIRRHETQTFAMIGDPSFGAGCGGEESHVEDVEGGEGGAGDLVDDA
ncbi:MAG: hypothetical protein L6R38_004155 [Xanthoria sp. 2 TBL-2021]|nr:MAG: hypothetical protein L6R38_004155 [Xanthoria sp. 2 TBL-2021]